MNDSLGDRMKEQYENRTRYFLPRRTYTIIRVDGKAFHTLTKGFDKPFDNKLMTIMDAVAIKMCEEVQGAQFAYVQSDEISILLTDFNTPQTCAWFNGNIQKMSSVSAAIATAEFNNLMSKTATFDSRVFTIPDPIEVENYFIWRQQDATRNSLQMATRAVFSHKECEGRNQSQMHDMLHTKNINWNDYSGREKRGGFIHKMDGRWRTMIDPLDFLKDRSVFSCYIPKIGVMND